MEQQLDYAAEQSDILKRFKNLTFFSYFSTFESIQRFLAVLSFVFFFLIIIMTCICGYLYLETHKRSLELIRQTNAVSTYLHQQKLINFKTLASRVATEFAYVGWNNIDQFKASIRPFIYPEVVNDVYQNIDSWGRVIVQGKLNRRLRKIDHEMVHVAEGRRHRNFSTYKVSIPMETEVRKEGTSRPDTFVSTFVVLFIVAEPSLNNPYGVYILEFGIANERKKDRT